MMASKQKSDVSIRKIILGCAVVLLACAASSWAAPAGSNARTSQPGETKTGIPPGHSRVSSNDSIEMVNVPAGTFMMGARDDGDDAIELVGNRGNYERPRHQVTLSAYQIGKYEVTNGQMCAVLNWALGKGYLKDVTNGAYTGGYIYWNGQLLMALDTYYSYSYLYCPIAYTARSGFSWKTMGGIDGNCSMENNPTVCVTWFGAVAFCNWLSEKEGLMPCYDLSSSNTLQWPLKFPYPNGYRLPTESEWERAAAWDGEKHWIYGYQSDTEVGQSRCNSALVNPLGLTTSFQYTSPVGWFNGINVSPNGNVQTIDSPSPVGCYDMSGNAEEWCEDWFHWDYKDAPIYGTPQETALSGRVIRGGSWIDSKCRTAYRDYSAPYDWSNFRGFRLARSLEPPEDTPTPTNTPTPEPTTTAMITPCPTLTPRVPSNDSIEMVNVPAGTFMMGARDDGDDTIIPSIPDYVEKPRHEVTLSPYKIGKYEVTNGQMCAVLNWALGKGYLKNSTNGTFTGGNVYLHGQALLCFVSDEPENPITYTSGNGFSWKTREGIGGNYSLENHPATQINWYCAVAFCNWLSEKEGLTPCYDLSSSNPTQWPLKVPYPNGYRLPTESEWERAAAWDGEKHWIYGYQSDTRLWAYKRCNCDCMFPDGIWDEPTNPLGFTNYTFSSPVGWFNGINVSPHGNVQTIDSPSPVGCYDMSGNAMEWCEDRFHRDYTDAPTDGTAQETPVAPYYVHRVVRGDFWHGRGRTAYRIPSLPYGWGTAHGFRVARNWEPTDESVTNISRPSYIVVKGELKPNKLVYIDSTYLYQNPIPPALYKQSHIRTAQADKDATAPASFLSFDVNGEVIIYVAIDARIATPPAWLSSWAFRIDQLVTDDPAEPNRKLYSKRFPKGHITLGPNRDPSMPQGKSMYTVVIIPVVTGVKDWSLYSQAK